MAIPVLSRFRRAQFVLTHTSHCRWWKTSRRIPAGNISAWRLFRLGRFGDIRPEICLGGRDALRQYHCSLFQRLGFPLVPIRRRRRSNGRGPIFRPAASCFRRCEPSEKLWSEAQVLNFYLLNKRFLL